MGEATLVLPLTTIVRHKMLGPPERPPPRVLADITKGFHDRPRRVERRLTEARFSAGERFTLADISVGYALFLAAFPLAPGRD